MPWSAEDTICAQATPRGEGAVGILRLSGPRALELVQRLCPGRTLGPRRMVGVRLEDPDSGAPLDQALVCYMPAPRSYTGQDVVEVHGHGGQLNMERLQAVLLSLGARRAEPGEFTRRAFLNGRMDLSQAEAVAQIIAARSERALKNAQALLQGQLGQRVQAIRQGLVRLAARLEANIDFAEDVGQQVSGEQLLGDHQRLARQIGALADSYQRGRTLDGITVALVGPVNAGKSSLFNCLLGTRRALVSQQPGTTRDYLEAETRWSGQRVVLVDTAGQRERPGPLEQQGQALAEPVLRRCDLALWVVDLSEPGSWPRGPAGQRELLVANKLDLAPAGALQRLRADSERPLVATSALDGRGLEPLKEQVLQRLCGPGQEGEGVQVTRARQHEALRSAGQAVEQGRQALQRGLPPEVVVEHSREALAYLGQITGEDCGEEVLDAVFASFCIGK
jgi:tRNA modification GTPase